MLHLLDLIKLEQQEQQQRGLTSSIIEGGGMDSSAQAMWNSSSAAAAAQAVSATAVSGTMAGMQVDWRETAEEHVIKADLPGVRKEEVRVELERSGVLIITGERHREVAQGDTWRQVERSSGKITRRLQLPENARMEGVKASMEHGVLTVLVPKAEPPVAQLNAGQ